MTNPAIQKKAYLSPSFIKLIWYVTRDSQKAVFLSVKSCRLLFKFQIRTAVDILKKKNQKFKFVTEYITKVQML